MHYIRTQTVGNKSYLSNALPQLGQQTVCLRAHTLDTNSCFFQSVLFKHKLWATNCNSSGSLRVQERLFPGVYNPKTRALSLNPVHNLLNISKDVLLPWNATNHELFSTVCARMQKFRRSATSCPQYVRQSRALEEVHVSRKSVLELVQNCGRRTFVGKRSVVKAHLASA